MGWRMLKLLSHTGASGLGGRSHDTLLRAASCYKDLLPSEMPQEENQTNMLLFTEQLKSFCLLNLYFTVVAQSSTHIPVHWIRPLASASSPCQDSGKEKQSVWPADLFRKSWLFLRDRLGRSPFPGEYGVSEKIND